MNIILELNTRCSQGRKFSALIVQSLRSSNHASVKPQIDKYLPSPDRYKPPLKSHYKTVIVGGGHNGLVAAAYLARAGTAIPLLEAITSCDTLSVGK